MGEFTYEHLFDILRKERSRDELQELSSTFYTEAMVYVEQEIAIARDADALSSMGQRTRSQAQNAKKLLKELYDRRERKIMLLALNKARTGSHIIDTSALLPSEHALFDAVLQQLHRMRKDILKTLVEQQRTSRPMVMEKPKAPVAPVSTDKMQLRITASVPKFLGSEMETYGPYEAGVEVALPQKIARILIKKGRAEAV